MHQTCLGCISDAWPLRSLQDQRATKCFYCRLAPLLAVGLGALGLATTASRSNMQPVGQCSAAGLAARQEVVARIKTEYNSLGGWPGPEKLPVVYNPVYNIGFLGLENLHPFDSKKYKKVVALLEAAGHLRREQLVEGHEATHEMLLDVHSPAYLKAIDTSPAKVAWVTELPPLALLPACLLRSRVLKPMRFMAGGTMLAAALAQEHGWAINVGGGLHHARHDDGGGWCVYDDIYLAIRKLRQASGGLVRTCMIIDLDVHQGNGYERDKLHFGDADTFIVDVYNGGIYPHDSAAKQAINVGVELPSGIKDTEYLEAVEGALQEAFSRCPCPNLVIYNAGTDILQGDPLGRLAVTAEGVARRDEMVWRAALAAGAPILMLLSGGYTAASTPCIAQSMARLFSSLGLGHGGRARGPEAAAAGDMSKQ